MSPGPLIPHDQGVLIHVWVVPGASSTGIVGLYGDRLKVRVAAAAESGKANRAVARLLEQHLGVGVELVRGMGGRHKMFLAADIELSAARSKLGV